jgi:hypothetical protein
LPLHFLRIHLYLQALTIARHPAYKSSKVCNFPSFEPILSAFRQGEGGKLQKRQLRIGAFLAKPARNSGKKGSAMQGGLNRPSGFFP